MPAVSVIIPVLDAHGTLGEALDSALAQTCTDFEILIAPDEPGDYSAFAARDRRIRVLPGVPAPTGPGPARNRAVAVARGDWLALLDADDLWSPNYLAALLPLAQAAGTAFGRTSVKDETGGELRSVPRRDHTGPVDFAVFAGAFASLHGLARRESPRRWHSIFAEDVLFDLETLALAGGSAGYVAEAVYALRPRARSATRNALFIAGIAAHYESIIAAIDGGETAIPNKFRRSAISVFESWAAMNDRFLKARATEPLLAYQNFVSGFKV
jgi:glycosyltransferase involved in cell wall biosynthesis